MSAEKLNLVQWEARVGELPSLVSMLSHDLYLEGRAPANAVAEAVRTLDVVAKKGRTQNGGRVPFRTQHACQEAVAQFEEMGRELAEAKDSMAKASTPEPWSKSRTSNWIARLGGLPDYIQHVSHGIKRSNPALSTGEAIQRAIGVVKDWARGGKNVDATTRAAAAKAVAEWEALKAKQHAKGAAKKATEATEDKLLSAATRLAFVVKPLPNQATFAKRYGNRMANFEGISRALGEGRPLAVAAAQELLGAPEGLPLDWLIEEFAERKTQTLILLEALGYGSTPIRARQGKKGSFHGMHGHENAVRKRKLIPHTPEHPVADVLASGGKLTESIGAATAVAFDPAKHPRQGGGEFGAKGGQPVGHAPPAQSDAAAQSSGVAAKIRANDPQFQKAQQELKQTAAFAAEHPPGAPQAPDQLQSLGYSNDSAGIVQFQKDNGLPTTGKLDAATQQTIQNVYGSNRAGAAGMPVDLTGIKGAGAPATTPSRTGAATGANSPTGTGGSPAAPGRKTLGKTSAKNINEAVRLAVREAIGDEPLMVMIAQGPPAGWHKQRERDENTDDFDFDDDTQQPPNLREGDVPTVCQTCAHFSPQGWITRRQVLGGCMKYSAQVDRTDLCDSYLTLSPPDATLRIHEARLFEAEESGDSEQIIEARARVKAIRQRREVQESIRREEAADEAFRIMESASGVVEAVDLSKEGRRKLAAKHHALADGSFPIPNVEFLKKAISAYGRAVAAGKGGKVKAWIVRRAKALGATNLLPDGWA